MSNYTHGLSVGSAAAFESAPALRRRLQTVDVIDLGGRSRPAPSVDVLGNVRVRNAARGFASHRALDLVVYLAFHRDGADAERLRTWLWPADAQPTARAFANVLSRARLGIGGDVHGHPYLSRAGTDRVYRLDQRVGTDVEELEAFIGQANASQDGQGELVALLNGLALVRGAPFTGGAVNSFAWADHSVRAQVVFLVDETAHRCADLALQLGDLVAARSAVFTGLSTIAACEQCYERRFRLAVAERNLTGLRSAMADLETVLAAEDASPTGEHLVSAHLRMLWNDLVDSLA